ncbi:transcriptional regulator, AraC family [Cellulomonas flavigena DSM 20109]|uniref:Transcriptional regulator, AraC family n=1 Tax=Cellulomonas flavigena (strain ATCC 482 / DSM 20109 / BCRC 11376 / JCM 18109 / NBRC 3775 / NCIMB 8073 / NRS 134) TaxID=446466 RepID=D5UE26_CELFN|nr:helix-turn-helix domain-containing protein [Cellulomonas flavigena]ADG76502.1 transcriptional regulator, AraC family [Cellulomonas flavigena DSM 20109]
MPRQHQVAVLALDDVVAFDLGMPAQVFHAATDAQNQRFYRVQTCTLGGRPVRTAAGFTVTPEHGLEALATADTVLVAGVYYGAEVMTSGAIDQEIVDALRSAHARGARIMSICTGAFVLAAAGLLDGMRATTHWAHAETFRSLFPAVELDPDVLFVHDEPISTSAGVGAGIDLCLQVVRDDHGSEVANLAARRCVVPAWRAGGQAQYIVRPVPRETDSSTSAARTWALEHLDEPLDLPQLAARARMSTRTFTRRFRDETGLSPSRWVAQQRLERARHLLEATDLPIDQVAEQSGFGTGATLRVQMSAALGIAPSAYRGTFRGKESVG